MKKTLVILSLFISAQAFSQKKEIQFGKISSKEIEMTQYEKDIDAKAVILYDKGESIFFDTDNGYDIQFTRHKRIKIFDKSESQYSEISIPYYVDGYGRTEVVKSIEAVTYNYKNGSLTQKRLDPLAVYEEKINNRWYNKKFVFPDVQNGSILEYRYVLETPFHFNLPDWTFQDKIPTIYSEYEVRMIPFYEYVFLVQEISKFDYKNSVVAKEKRSWGSVNKSYGQNMSSGIEFQDYVHTYVLKDVPAFKDESFVSSVNDYIIKMDFQLAKFHSPHGGTSEIISTWPALNESLLKHEKFGKYIKGSNRYAKNILKEDLDITGLDETEKTKIIINYVKNNFEWNGYNSKYTSQSIKDFIKTKKGNAADINLFLIALLNEAGIDAQPIILSTRNHGKIHVNYPFDHFTNYVAVLVNSSHSFLTDATELILPFNMIPSRCLNEKGLVVNKGTEPKWIYLQNIAPSLEKNVISLSIDTLTLDATAEVLIQSTNYEAYSNRKNFNDDTLQIKNFYSDMLKSVSRVKTINYKKKLKPYTISIDGKYETEKLGSTIIIKPFLELPIAKNNLTQRKRTYPVDFIYQWDNQFECKLDIPKGYHITTLPKPLKINNELVEINLNYSSDNGIITAKGNYYFKKSIYVANEYSRIKYYLDEIVKHFNQDVVVEKMNKEALIL